MANAERDACPRCGAPIAPSWVFCQTCGVSLEQIDQHPPRPPEGRNSRVGVTLAIVIAGLLAVGGGVVTARSILSNEVEQEPFAPSASETTVEISTEDEVPTTSSERRVVTTPPATTTTSTVQVTPTTVFGDLDIRVPMDQPACDGSYITLIGASVEPDNYRTEISRILNSFPGSNYLRTDVTCLSLRQELEGNPIYAVFFGPFSTFREACGARSLGPQGSYVKRLDNVSDATELLACR